MHNHKNALLLILLLASVCLIGLGSTGMVVSQSCCFLPFCESGNICDAANMDDGYLDTDQIFLFMGVAMFISTFVAYSLINRR